MISTGSEAENGCRVIAANAADAVAMAAGLLQAGNVVGIPTDTVYGLAAAIDQPKALARLYQLKRRAAEKAIPVLLGDLDDLSLVAASIPSSARRLAARFWPGALTLVLPARAGLLEPLTSISSSGTRTVAVRIPDHVAARAIIRASGGRLAVTSANRAGEEPCRSATAVASLGDAAPDLVIDAGWSPGGVPSTIVSVLEESLTILRVGAIPCDAVTAVAGMMPTEARTLPRGV